MEKITNNEEIMEQVEVEETQKKKRGKKHRRNYKPINGKKILKNLAWFFAGAATTIGAAMVFGGDHNS